MKRETKKRLSVFTKIAMNVTATVAGAILIYVGISAKQVVKDIKQIPANTASIKGLSANDSMHSVRISKVLAQHTIDSILMANRMDKINTKFEIIVNGINSINQKIGNQPLFVPKSAYQDQAQLAPKVK